MVDILPASGQNICINYVRDKRSPIPKNALVSRVMSANRAKNTSPEVALRKALWHSGHRGYRLHHKKVPGRPDISFVSKKIAIFVHGCFWHRCPKCSLKLPRTNPDFWKAKFERNQIRDEQKKVNLEKLGWTVLTFWECDLKTGLRSVIKEINNVLSYD